MNTFKRLLCATGTAVLALVFAAALILFVGGIADKIPSMAVCGFILGALAITGCVFLVKKMPQRKIREKKQEKLKRESVKKPTEPIFERTKVQGSSRLDTHKSSLNALKRKKTITCRTCGAEISPRARRCPHCGEMTPAEVFSSTVTGCVLAPFLAIIILIAIAFYFGFFSWFLK